MENQYLLELIGKSFNAKVKHDAQSYMKEQTLKYFGGHMPLFKETAFVFAHKNGEIKSIGASCVNDLFLDSFGKWLAGMIRTPTTAQFNILMTDDLSVSHPVFLYKTGVGSFNVATGASGTYLKIGSGSTPPARGDVKIETDLPTSPEKDYLGTNTGVWNTSTGKITCANSAVAGGAGTVNESGLFGVWFNSSSALKNFMLCHDAISPAVPFVLGQTLTTEYVISI